MIEEIKEIRSYLEKRLDRIEAAMLPDTPENNDKNQRKEDYYD